jgi:hypothetical protein
MLWSFSFEHAMHKQGEKIPPSTEAVTQGIVCQPKPFPPRLVERDVELTKKVSKGWKNAKELLGG